MVDHDEGSMRYIVKAPAGDFGQIRVLVENATEAIRVARDLEFRAVGGVTIIDADGRDQPASAFAVDEGEPNQLVQRAS